MIILRSIFIRLFWNFWNNLEYN